MTRNLNRLIVGALAFLALIGTAAAEEEDKWAGLDSGNTAWMITATVLVLFMTLPGLALFYGGLVRSKNVLSVLMHCFAIACLASILWVVFLYSLAFSDGGKILGDMQHLFLNGVDGLNGGDFPETVFVMFQMTFAIITPALVVGAFVERMRFGAVLLFTALWLTIVYVPVAHWVWASAGWMFEAGTLDLAGGIVVHTTAGLSALVLAKMLGPRKGFPDSVKPPHNPGMVMIGAAMLWVGWFGFNAGSQGAANGGAGLTMLVTHIAAATASLTWMVVEKIKTGKAGLVGIVTGMVAGLATITPASGNVGPIGALILGFLAGFVCYFACGFVKEKLGGRRHPRCLRGPRRGRHDGIHSRCRPGNQCLWWVWSGKCRGPAQDPAYRGRGHRSPLHSGNRGHRLYPQGYHRIPGLRGGGRMRDSTRASTGRVAIPSTKRHYHPVFIPSPREGSLERPVFLEPSLRQSRPSHVRTRSPVFSRDLSKYILIIWVA